MLYVYAGYGSRAVSKAIEVLNFVFASSNPYAVPSHTVILDWMKKCGLAELKKGPKTIKDSYSLIIDHSINMGNQQLFLELLVPEAPSGQPLTRRDVQIAGMQVSDSWTSDKVTKVLLQTQQQIGSPAKYVTSDNGRILVRACKDAGIIRHSDISHSFGLYLEQVYENDKEFTKYVANLAIARKYMHSDLCGLTPSFMRKHSRFMNLFESADWAFAMSKNYHKLPQKAQEVFGFVQEQHDFIYELHHVLNVVRQIEKLCKTQGLTHEIAEQCINIIHSKLYVKGGRPLQLAKLMTEYYHRETQLVAEGESHHICSDIIESIFGSFKQRLSPNPHNGYTMQTMLLPMHIRLADSTMCMTFNTKDVMEQTHYKDLKNQKLISLLKNPLIERQRICKKYSNLHTKQRA